MSVKNGAVCFTFDDAAYDQWIEVLPLWAKYNAHATFFAAGEINQLAVEAMKQLQSAGHTVGLHSLHHADAVIFQRLTGKVDHHAKNDAQHHRHDDHVDANEFDPKLFQHGSSTSR